MNILVVSPEGTPSLREIYLNEYFENEGINSKAYACTMNEAKDMAVDYDVILLDSQIGFLSKTLSVVAPDALILRAPHTFAIPWGESIYIYITS